MLRTIVNIARQGAANLAYRAARRLGYSAEHWAAIGGRSLSIAVSGKTVTVDAAYKVAAFKRGVQLISDYIGKTPFHVRAEKAKAKNHAAWPLVRRWAIWHEMSALQFRRVLTVHALVRGNGYGWIQRDPVTYLPAQIRILDPSRIEPHLARGVLLYRIVGTDRVLQASDVIHIRGFGDDGYTGLDPITTYARDVLGLSIAQQDYAGGYFAAGGQPGLYAHSAVPLSKEAWDRLESEAGPLRNAVDDPHRIPVLEQLELRTTALSPQQTQLLECREFSLKDIANALGMTVHKLNGEGTGGYKSLEEENRAFRDDTLDPFLCQFEEQYAKLLTEDEQASESFEVEAVRESLTRTNMLDRAKYLQTAIGGPWMTPAEGREVDSLEQIDGADVLYPPPNMTRPDAQSGGTDETDNSRSIPPAGSRSDNQQPLSGPDLQLQTAALTDVLSRMTKRLAVQGAKAASKSATFLEFCDTLQERNAAVIREALLPVVGLCIGGQRAGTVATELADGLVRDFESGCRTLYDSQPKDRFAAAVAGHGDLFEESAAVRAGKAVAAWKA